MTIEVWEKVKAKMLPTPAKFHYIFNLRDLSRVFQGVFMAPVREVLHSDTVLLSLWKHECERVFADRLVDDVDKGWFASTMNRLLEDRFSITKAATVREPSYFVDFMRDGEEDPETGEELPAPHVYEPVKDMEALRQRVSRFLGRFNEVHRLFAVDVVLFNDAMHHFMRVCRILRTPRGSALLVGVGGSGKQTLTRLAAYTAGATFFQSTITKTYSATNLLEDFKPLYLQAGVQGRGVAFIFTDKEIKDEGFLEYINIFVRRSRLAQGVSHVAAAASPPRRLRRQLAAAQPPRRRRSSTRASFPTSSRETSSTPSWARPHLRTPSLRWRAPTKSQVRTTCGPSSSSACAPTCTSCSASRPSEKSFAAGRRSTGLKFPPPPPPSLPASHPMKAAAS